MNGLTRVIAQAARGHRHSPARFALLSLLIAIGLVIFLVVSALSRASTDTLSEAIESDVGAAGTYHITMNSTLGLTGAEITEQVTTALAPMAVRPIEVVESFNNHRADCPPFEALTSIDLAVLRDADYLPKPLPFGENLPAGVQFCLAGLHVPGSSLWIPDESAKLRYGANTIFMESIYAPQVELIDTTPVDYVFTIVTGIKTEQGEQLRERVEAALAEHITRLGYISKQAVVVNRVDSGDNVRAASEGVQLVYGIIAWGVLILGGLGILVAQLIMLRDRTWFFGLSRAMGATPADVATLVIADAAIVVAGGTVGALVLVIAGQPLISSFSVQAFQIPLTLLDPAVAPQLLLGISAILLVGAALLAWKATRLDPLDILERR